MKSSHLQVAARRYHEAAASSSSKYMLVTINNACPIRSKSMAHAFTQEKFILIEFRSSGTFKSLKEALMTAFMLALMDF